MIDTGGLEPAQGVVVAALDGTGDLDRCDLARDGGQRHLAFAPRHQLTDAHVNAGSEADMASGFAGDVVAIGFAPTARVADRRAQEHQGLLAFAHARATDLDLARRGGEEGLHRTFEPHGFLERKPDCLKRGRHNLWRPSQRSSRQSV